MSIFKAYYICNNIIIPTEYNGKTNILYIDLNKQKV